MWSSNLMGGAFVLAMSALAGGNAVAQSALAPGTVAPRAAAISAAARSVPQQSTAAQGPSGSAPERLADRFVVYSGLAAARDGGAPLYEEHHALHYRGERLEERVVLYTCPGSARAFARKEVQYRDPLAPDFTLEDASTGLREGVETAAPERTVFYRADRSTPEKRRSLAAPPGLVADAGFDEFVRRHWQGLVKGQTGSLRFLVPSRLRDYRFEVEHLRSERSQGRSVEVFRLNLPPPWGWFTSGIDVYYAADERLLVHYEGLSDLRDAANINYSVRIDFPPALRHDADAQAFEALRAAPLGRCTVRGEPDAPARERS
jgi:hypothetical protein